MKEVGKGKKKEIGKTLDRTDGKKKEERERTKGRKERQKERKEGVKERGEKEEEKKGRKISDIAPW